MQLGFQGFNASQSNVWMHLVLNIRMSSNYGKRMQPCWIRRKKFLKIGKCPVTRYHFNFALVVWIFTQQLQLHYFGYVGPYAWVKYVPDQPILSNQPNVGSCKRRNEKKRMKQKHTFIMVSVKHLFSFCLLLLHCYTQFGVLF